MVFCQRDGNFNKIFGKLVFTECRGQKMSSRTIKSVTTIWRRGWDSNPCAIARKLISSQPRYDHFDTSPYMLTRHTEINAIFSCIRIPVRTGIVLETMECPKPAWLKGFRRFGFRLAKKISSAAPSTTRTTLRATGLLYSKHRRFVNHK